MTDGEELKEFIKISLLSFCRPVRQRCCFVHVTKQYSCHEAGGESEAGVCHEISAVKP